MLYENKLWLEDIDKVITTTTGLSRLKGRSVLITGANGLICSAVVDILFRYNDIYDGEIEIIAAGRSFERIKERFGNCVEREDFFFVPFNMLNSEWNIDKKADYIIHGAGNAFPAVVMKEPVETLCGSINGTRSLLEYANRCNTKKFLYISSSEVYGSKDGNLPFKEDDYGYSDILNPRNSYSMGKKSAETLCASYSEEYAINTVIARPGHIYGPTASRKDNRVSSAWAYAAAEGKDIIMKSDGAQIRSYCYCLDCASAIITILINGENRRAYNISNSNSVISIRNLAEILSGFSGVKLITETPDNKEKQAFNPMENSSLDSTSLMDLGWRGIFDAETGLKHTVELLKIK